MRSKCGWMQRVVFCCLSGILAFSAAAAKESADGFVVKAWMIGDGLPQNSIISFCQSRSGVIWLGTELGLVRFNGVSFRIFNRWNTPQIKDNRINCLAEDARGTLWVGTGDGGLSSFAEGVWKSHGRESGLSGISVNSMVACSSGETWISTDAGISFQRGGAWSAPGTVSGLPSVPVDAWLCDSQGRLWAGGEKGLFRRMERSGAKAYRFVQANPEPVQVLAQDSEGRIWAGGRSGLLQLDPASGRTLAPVPDFSGQEISTISPAAGRGIWVGTRGQGLYLYNGEIVNHLTGANGLSDDFVQTFASDSQGNLWVGTLAGGINRLKPRSARLITRDDGLPGNLVQSVLEGADGSLWVGTQRWGLLRRDVGTESWSPVAQPGIDVHALHRTMSGGLWIGSQTGLFRMAGSVIEPIPGFEEVNVIWEDRGGALYVGGDDGLSRRLSGQSAFSVVEAFRDVTVNDLAESEGGLIWVATGQGLYQGSGDQFQRILAGEPVNSLNVSRVIPGVVWAGTNSGLVAARKGQLTRWTESDGLFSNRISSILENGAGAKGLGDLWLGSQQGVFHVAIVDLQSKLSGRPASLVSVFLSEEDGIIRGESPVGSQPAAWRAASGSLYFATSQGLLVVTPQSQNSAAKPPPVIIEDIRLDNQSLAPRAGQELPPGQHLLEFYFTLPDFSAPSKVRLKYRLEGFDPDWKMGETGKPGAALYYNLKPGRYTFRASGCSGDGRWSSAETLFSFRIGAYFPLLLVVVPLLVLVTAAFGLYFQRGRGSREEEPAEPKKKYQTSALTSDRADEIVRKLKEAIEKDQVYLSASLTMKKLSEKLLVHPNHISQVINERFRQSFNDYINRWRIEEAKRRLLDPAKSRQSILEIAYEVGFYSKSVFNTAFKKFTGQTPSDFRGEKRESDD